MLPECGTFSTTTRVVLAVTLYVSFFDGCWIAARGLLCRFCGGLWCA